MIRTATAEDIPRIVEMGATFLAGPEYQGKIRCNETALRQFAEQHLADFLLCDDGGRLTGMLALLIYPHPFSGEITAVELCWWVEPEHRGSSGLKLLRAAETKAREAGATKLMLGAPSERTEALYQRLGMERVEVTYQRQL